MERVPEKCAKRHIFWMKIGEAYDMIETKKEEQRLEIGFYEIFT